MSSDEEDGSVAGTDAEVASTGEGVSAEDYGPPFSRKTFGGAFVWARAPAFVATVLRIQSGQNVAISTHDRRDMTLMLTAGRAVLEVQSSDGTDRVELLPAAPIVMDPTATHRLLALTEVELFTVYTPQLA